MSQHPTDYLIACLHEARRGSPDALGQALEFCRDYLLSIALQELSPQIQARGGASDLVQETFIAAQKGFHQFQGTTVPEWYAWLRQILLRQILYFARTHRDTAKREIGREEMPVDDLVKFGNVPVEWDTPSEDLKSLEQTQQIEQAMTRLPEECRNVLQWRYQDGLSFAEIAMRLQRSENASRQLLLRAIKQMRQELDNLHV